MEQPRHVVVDRLLFGLRAWFDRGRRSVCRGIGRVFLRPDRPRVGGGRFSGFEDSTWRRFTRVVFQQRQRAEPGKNVVGRSVVVAAIVHLDGPNHFRHRVGCFGRVSDDGRSDYFAACFFRGGQCRCFDLLMAAFQFSARGFKFFDLPIQSRLADFELLFNFDLPISLSDLLLLEFAALAVELGRPLLALLQSSGQPSVQLIALDHPFLLLPLKLFAGDG